MDTADTIREPVHKGRHNSTWLILVAAAISLAVAVYWESARFFIAFAWFIVGLLLAERRYKDSKDQ